MVQLLINERLFPPHLPLEHRWTRMPWQPMSATPQIDIRTVYDATSPQMRDPSTITHTLCVTEWHCSPTLILTWSLNEERVADIPTVFYVHL